jgi:hypothetical protein
MHRAANMRIETRMLAHKISAAEVKELRMQVLF